MDSEYKLLISNILETGTTLQTRNSKCTRIIGPSIVFDKCPLVSIRRTAWKTALREMEWFLSGSNNLKDLHPSVHPWWKPWADSDGCIKYNYGVQFGRQFPQFLAGIKKHPLSRRNVLTTWTPEMWERDCPITNCHGTVLQAFVDIGGTDKLTLVTYQRSVDVICGLPHNWIQYWALALYIARVTGCSQQVELQWIGGDTHIYAEHEELARKILNGPDQSHEMYYNGLGDTTFRADDFTLEGKYEPWCEDKAELIV